MQTIILANNIVTMDPDVPSASAIAISDDGRITAVGTRDDVMSSAGADAKTIDLGDVCVLPGLIEPHTHPDLCAQCYAWVDVSGFTHKSEASVEAALEEAVANTPDGEWIYAFGLDPMLTEDLGTWGRKKLDQISPDNPIAVMIQSMHTIFVNSLAFDAAGVDDDTPDPPGGGRYQKDQDGHLTGKIEEAPALLPFLRFDAPPPELMTSRMWDQYERYASAGLTTIGIPGLFTPISMLGVFEAFSERADVPIRTVAYMRHHQVDQTEWRPGDGNDRFTIQGVKLWYDGSPYSGTMLLDEPYLESKLCCCTLGIPAGTTGHANFAPDELLELTTRLHAEGWQILTHAQGDRGTREILDLYEKALAENPASDHRWRLEHCALISREDLERAARLGVTPSFHVNHVYYYGKELRDSIIGSDRAAGLMPVGTAIESGHRVSLHADSPMYPPEPFRLMRTAVTRRARGGEQIAANEAITAEQALRAVTIDAAWHLFAEDRVGSLTPGKFADMTVVDSNPLTINPDDLDRIEVLETWLSGKRAYQRAGRTVGTIG
ncbi:MAG: amidohydrolase [Myxococcota bacterium]|jgi:predicted amidohydrolase YtcJ|nr:amidohydrolase [Myxococcota bacterium]